MKANELRENCKLLFLGEIVTFDYITKKRDDGIFWIKTKEHNLDHKNFHFKPIELTEEILLKCGFVKDKSDSDNAWLNLRYRFLNFSSDESVGFKKVYLLLGKTEIICDYLHELQNLYRCLVGKELEINL